MVGPYQVGHSEYFTSKGGNAVSVYYPMDKSEYKRTITKRGRNTKWLRWGKSSLLGISHAAGDFDKKKPPPLCLFNYLRRIKT